VIRVEDVAASPASLVTSVMSVNRISSTLDRTAASKSTQFLLPCFELPRNPLVQ